jgi:hypothetical protein
MGLVLARWSYTRIEELVAGGLHEAVDGLQQDLNRLHELIEQRYFIAPTASLPLPTPGSSTSTDPACAPS